LQALRARGQRFSDVEAAPEAEKKPALDDLIFRGAREARTPSARRLRQILENAQANKTPDKEEISVSNGMGSFS
jgi:hypothetical protein